MNDYKQFDQLSFDLGMIEAFCEMIHVGLKPLGLSPIIPVKNLERTQELSLSIEKKFGVKSYVEMDFIHSDLATDDELRDSAVIFYYNEDSVINRYFALKEMAKAEPDNPRISMEFRLLLGYPRKKILGKYLPMLTAKDLADFIAESSNTVEIEQALYCLSRGQKSFLTAKISFPKLPGSNPYYVNNIQLYKASMLSEELVGYKLEEESSDIGEALESVKDKLSGLGLSNVISVIAAPGITQIAFSGGTRSNLESDNISLFELSYFNEAQKETLKNFVTDTVSRFDAAVTFESGE